MGTIIITEYNNNEHQYVSDGTERMSDVTAISDWTCDFAQDLVWTEDAVDAVTSFTADSCQSAYVFDLDTALQDDMDSDVADDGLAVDSSLDSESNDSALDLMDEEDLSDVQSILASRMIVKQDGMGTSYPELLCDTDLDLAMDDAFDAVFDNDRCISDYDLYSEDDFKDMEAFYEQSMAECETHEENFDGSEEEDDDWFINRLPIFKDTKHNPFVDLTEEDVERALQEYRKDKEQRNKQTNNQKNVWNFDEDVSVVDVKNDLHRKPFIDDSAFTEPKSDWDEKNNFEKQKEPDFSKSNGMQEEKEQVSKIQEQMSKKEVLRSVDWVTQEDVSRGTVYPSDAKPKESVDPWETVKKSHSEKVSGKKTCSSFSDLLFVCESFPSFRTKEVGDRSLPLAVLQIQRNRGLPK